MRALIKWDPRASHFPTRVHIVFSNPSIFPFMYSYQLKALMASLPGKQIVAMTLDWFPSIDFRMEVCPVISIDRYKKSIDLLLVQPFVGVIKMGVMTSILLMCLRWTCKIIFKFIFLESIWSQALFVCMSLIGDRSPIQSPVPSSKSSSDSHPCKGPFLFPLPDCNSDQVCQIPDLATVRPIALAFNLLFYFWPMQLFNLFWIRALLKI